MDAATTPGAVSRYRRQLGVLIPALVAAAVGQACFVRDAGRTLDRDAFAALGVALAVLSAAGPVLQLTVARAAAIGAAPPARPAAGRVLAAASVAGLALAALAFPLRDALHLPSAMPLLLLGPLLAVVAPLVWLLGAAQGAGQFVRYGLLLGGESLARWPAAAALRACGVPGAAASMGALLGTTSVAVCVAFALAPGAPAANAAPAPARSWRFAGHAAVTMAALALLSVGDVFAVQRASPGAAGGAAYAAASTLGRAAATVWLPLTTALFPAVAGALARGEDPRRLVRRSLVGGTVVSIATALGIAAAAAPLTGLLYPGYPDAVALVRLLPLVTLPYGAVACLATCRLAAGRPVAAWLVGGLAVQWAGFALVGGRTDGVVMVLGLVAAGLCAALGRSALPPVAPARGV